MATGGRNFQRTTGLCLAFHIGQVRIVISVQKIWLFWPREGIVTHEVVAYLTQGMRYPYRGTFGQCCFATGGLRQNQRTASLVAG